VLIAFIASYATAKLGMDRTQVLLMTTLAAAAWLVTTLWSGALSDRIGRIRTFQIGYVALIVWMIPLFLLIDTANIWLLGLGVVVMTVGLGFAYGPMSALYAEMFPVEVRYSGVSIGYAIGAILGGAFAATIAQALMDATHWSPSVGIYVIVLSLISLAAVSTVRETGGVNLRVRRSAGDEGSETQNDATITKLA
jgi:MFS family permease